MKENDEKLFTKITQDPECLAADSAITEDRKQQEKLEQERKEAEQKTSFRNRTNSDKKPSSGQIMARVDQ